MLGSTRKTLSSVRWILRKIYHLTSLLHAVNVYNAQSNCIKSEKEDGDWITSDLQCTTYTCRRNLKTAVLETLNLLIQTEHQLQLQMSKYSTVICKMVYDVCEILVRQFQH